MYTLQRLSGVFIAVFLVYHTLVDDAQQVLRHPQHPEPSCSYAAWQEKLTSYGYFFLVFYMLGVLASSYHLGYGIWNFCIRWGITISDRAQRQVQRLSLGIFLLLTALGWASLGGFLIHKPEPETTTVAAPGRAPVARV